MTSEVPSDRPGSIDLRQVRAHTPNRLGGEDCLCDHLQNVARLARRFGEAFGCGALAEVIGLWHDLGKINLAFQRYLEACTEGRPHGQKIPHAICGAAYAYKLLRHRYGDDGWQELAMCILAHHAGLVAEAAAGRKLHVWWSDGRNAEVKQRTQLALDRIPTRPIPPHTRLHPLRREMRMRMLFSALVDADYIATERHFEPALTSQRADWTRPADLWHVFRPNQLQMMWHGRGRSRVNRIRGQIYRACVRAAKWPPGVFRLTVPTGGGKTRNGLAFALRHAVEHPRHRFRRVIVALPYTSIIDQNARVYRQILGDRFVLEHHSQVEVRDNERQDENHVRHRLSAENWDCPLVVTTTVQLFESLFSNKPSRCRKLHNIARSILILDEVQTLPPELLEPTLDALRDLVDNYGVTLVLSTATQPAFDETPYLRTFDGLKIEPIVPEPERFFQHPDMKRVEYQPVRWEQDLNELADELCRPDAQQAMVIFNTRKAALDMLDRLAARRAEGLYHLSTLLCGAHRRRLLEEIQRRLDPDDPQPVRLVSTQVVEAGVDLDFPLVYRALGPLDRIVQAAGRCNREGRRPEKGRVVVFDFVDNRSPPGAYKIGVQDAETILKRNTPERLHEPALYTEYFQSLFRDVDLDKKDIQPYRRDRDYPEVARRYKLIEDTVMVVVPKYDNNKGERLLKKHLASPCRESWRRLLPYTVNLRQQDVRKLQDCLEPLSDTLYRWTGAYDDKTHRGLLGAVYDPADLYVGEDSR